jgi:hypothetical protein
MATVTVETEVQNTPVTEIGSPPNQQTRMVVDNSVNIFA